MALNGYEDESISEIEAILDDSPSDANDVYVKTIGYSERAIAAVAAKRAGAGESGALSVLRSPVYNAVDYSDGFHVFTGSIPAGTLVVKLFALISLDLDWTGGGAAPSLTLSLGPISQPTNYNDLVVYDLNNGFPNGGFVTNERSEFMPINGFSADTELTNIARACVFADDDADVLLNFADFGTFTGGTYEIGVLVSTP